VNLGYPAAGIAMSAIAAKPTKAATALDLALLLTLGAAIRFAVYQRLPNVVWLDEIYQVLEPAHRLAFGTGIIPWEWQVGMRSWLFPGVLAPLLRAGGWLSNDPELVKLPVGVAMIAASCVPIVCGYLWGRSLFDRRGGIVVGAVLAVWVDLVYLAAHTFNEVIAGDVLAAAAYLALAPARRVTGRRLFAAGCLAGAAVALRFQLGPAVLVAAVAGCERHGDRWRHYLAGASLPLLALGIVDWLTLGTAFQSVWLNLYLNWVRHVSDDYGRLPWYFYPGLFAAIWGAAFPLIIALVAIGARRAPALLGVALAIVVTHSFVAHKEYRFVYPALPLLLTLAALGTVELVRRVRGAAAGQASWALVIAGWTAISASIAHSAIFSVPWSRFRGALTAYENAATSPGLCGCASYGVSLGASALPPAVPLYQTGADRLARDAPGFNLLVTGAGVAVPYQRFSLVGCFGGDFDPAGRPQASFCVWRRAGGCVPGVASPQSATWPRSLGGTDYRSE
jgi:phosphatidylinositol glycan class B